MNSVKRESGATPDGCAIRLRCAIMTEGAQAAAAAWAALERELLERRPLAEALAYAQSVIEWGALGDAEKRRRKKRRRLAMGRKQLAHNVC